MYDPLRLLPPALPRLFIIPLALLGLTACGIVFSSTFEGTEMFKGIEVRGNLRPGSELTVIVGIEPVYPVPVELACFYEDDDILTEDQEKLAFHDRAVLVGRAIVEAAAPGIKPGDDVERQHFHFTFEAPPPGDYFVACLTPAAPENGIGVSFDILPPP